MKKVIKLNDDAVAIIENKCVSIVQQLFSDKSVVVLSIDDIERIVEEYKGGQIPHGSRYCMGNTTSEVKG